MFFFWSFKVKSSRQLWCEFVFCCICRWGGSIIVIRIWNYLFRANSIYVNCVKKYPMWQMKRVNPQNCKRLTVLKVFAYRSQFNFSIYFFLFSSAVILWNTSVRFVSCIYIFLFGLSLYYQFIFVVAIFYSLQICWTKVNILFTLVLLLLEHGFTDCYCFFIFDSEVKGLGGLLTTLLSSQIWRFRIIWFFFVD
jgi:hypothetical protein